MGSEPRTRLAGGPFVDTTTTLALFNDWKRSGVSQGVIIDRLAAYAVTTGFNPATNKPFPPVKKPSPVAPKHTRG